MSSQVLQVTPHIVGLVPSVIYRALYLSVERDKERTDNICVITPGHNTLHVGAVANGFFDSMFNHSPLRFTFVTSRWSGSRCNWVPLELQ